MDKLTLCLWTKLTKWTMDILEQYIQKLTILDNEDNRTRIWTKLDNLDN